MFEPMGGTLLNLTFQHCECVAAQELPPERDIAGALDATTVSIRVRRVDDLHPVGVLAQTVFLNKEHPQTFGHDMFPEYDGSGRDHE